MGMLPMDKFMCWKLKVAMIAICCYIIIFASVATLLEILDIADQFSSSFTITGGFNASWRMHVWEGWLATNIVMLVLHVIMIATSVMMFLGVKRFPTFYEFSLTKLFMVFMICYTLAELGVACYRYSWYSKNTFRLAYLVFTFLFWLIRTIIQIIAIAVLYSRIEELRYEITYGEKKLLSNTTFLEQSFSRARSGLSTPRSGYNKSGSQQLLAGPPSQSYA